jgi:uncharacterized protein (DUF1501 family)
MDGLHLTRRSALLGLSAAFTLGRSSLALGAAPTERRFVVVLLRGAMDGLSAVQPYGDPAFAGLRGNLAMPGPGQDGGVLDLGGFYGLHPALSNLHGMYRAGDALILHAVAGHYRSRSHFEAQDYLESGADQRLSSGWLNRAVAAMPANGRELALTVGLSAPLLLRGPARVESWAPDHFAQPSNDLYLRIAGLCAHDPILGPAIDEGIRQRGVDASLITGQPDKQAKSLTVLADAAGRLLCPAWRNTVVLAVTEFGRTARVNGTNGTDHGTGGVAFVMGGAVAGGRVRADWPGLGAGRLFEDRDLMPSADVRAVAKGLLGAHMGLGSGALAGVFPGSGDVQPMSGLVRA